MSHATHHPEDKGAALTGFIVGAILIGSIMFGIVYLTNSHYAGEKKGAEATETK
jgi:hypothetical protein